MSIKTLIWKKEQTLQAAGKPTSREGHSFLFVPELARYFLFGGISSNRNADIYSYDARK